MFRRLSVVFVALLTALVLALGVVCVPAKAASTAPLPDEPYQNDIWPLSGGDAFVYATYDSADSVTRFCRYDLEDGSVAVIATFERYFSEGTYFVVGDTLYYFSNSFRFENGSAEYFIEVYALDMQDGASTKLFETTALGSYFASVIGADAQGRVFLASTATLLVFDADGTLLASIDNPGIRSFVGFDGTNGNFYYQGTADTLYYGYNRTMICLKVGNFDGTTITYNDKSITMFYQLYTYGHYGCAELLDGRYLAGLCMFDKGKLAVMDSHAIGVDDVLDAATEIQTAGGYAVTTVALPEDCVLFGSDTQPTTYGNGAETSSVGVRCAYDARNGRLAVVTEAQKVTLFDLATGERLAQATASQPVYRLMVVGDYAVFIERDAEGNYLVERIPMSLETNVVLSGPQNLSVRSSADYTAIFDGGFVSTYTFESSDPTVLSVDSQGHAATWKAGTATIVVRTAHGVQNTMLVRVSGGEAHKTLADVTSIDGAMSRNWNYNDYYSWSSPISSYLVETQQGLMCVQADGSAVKISYLDASGHATSSRTLDFELPRWGGFFAGTDAYYVVYGQNNPDQDDALPVLRVVKYDFSWQRLGSCDLFGANTVSPVNFGSLRMDEDNGVLYVYTCHTMYQSSDGYNHQSNLTMVVDEASMTITQSFYGISNISAGYVSHSFNQFIRVQDGIVYRVDHGDAYPRGVAFTATPTSSSITGVSAYGSLVVFPGNVGANYTGASLGGLEISDTSVLVAYNQDTELGSGVRNIYVAALNRQTGEVATIPITSYDEGSKISANTPQLVKLDGRHFVLMWAEWNGAYQRYTAKFVLLDMSGQPVCEIVEKVLPLSDCQPVVLSDGSVAWVVSDGATSALYALDPYDLASMGEDSLGGNLSVSLAYATIDAIDDQEYSGNAVEPELTIRFGGKTLVKGKDYTATFANNTKAGTATVSVSGIGLYKGKLTAEFRIVHAPGWAFEEDAWYYYDEAGEKLKGVTQNIGGKYYYFDADGKRATDTILPGGSKYYYFGKDGALALKSWFTYGGKSYYADATGALVTNGVVVAGKAIYYMGADGTPVGNTVVPIGGKYYYFGSDGKLVADTFLPGGDGKYYYFGPDGALKVKTWFTYGGKSYYADEKGAIVTNDWVVVGKAMYYMGADGTPVGDATLKFGNNYYHFGSDGKLVWNVILEGENGELYYFGGDAALVIGRWFSYNGNAYYARATGVLAQDEWIAFGKTNYHFNEKGICDQAVAK